MAELYENIKRERMAKGLSQEELAHMVGYADKGMISRIENGKVDLPQSKIKEFADVLDVTPGYLMGWDVPREPVGFEIQAQGGTGKSDAISRALKLYELYENATPEARQLVENFLKSSQDKK